MITITVITAAFVIIGAFKDGATANLFSSKSAE